MKKTRRKKEKKQEIRKIIHIISFLIHTTTLIIPQHCHWNIWREKKKKCPGFRYEAIKFAQLMDGVCIIKHSISKLEFYVTKLRRIWKAPKYSKCDLWLCRVNFHEYWLVFAEVPHRNYIKNKRILIKHIFVVRLATGGHVCVRRWIVGKPSIYAHSPILPPAPV